MTGRSGSVPYLPLANSPNESRRSSDCSQPSPTAAGFFIPGGIARPNRLSINRRVFLAAGVVSLVCLGIATSFIDRGHVPIRVLEAVNQGRGAYSEVVSAIWESKLLGGYGGYEAVDHTDAAVSSSLDASPSSFTTADIVAIQAGVRGSNSASPPNGPSEENLLDHSVFAPPPTAKVVCSPALQEQLAQANFWKLEKSQPLEYRISASDPTAAPSGCLEHAVFAARLVSVSSDGSTLDPPEPQTLFSLDPPVWQPDSDSYLVAIPADARIPRKRYRVEVQLEFGYYPGLRDGMPCGLDGRKCKPQTLSAAAGKGLHFVGELIAGDLKTVELGQADLAKETALSSCSDLSSISGYWSDLSFYPSKPPCSLAIPSLPLPASLESPARTKPLWIHLVGDSNTRNTYKHLIDSLEGGFHTSGPVVMDSTTHNGTLASLAFRYRAGAPAADETAQIPDIIVTWMWWYQAAPLSSAGFLGDDEAEDLDPAIEENRRELLSFVDTDLSTFLRTAQLDPAFKHFPLLETASKGVRPFRTYLSLGSHGEDLAVPGVAASLDALFDESVGLSRQKRDTANLRLVTTTLVNSRHIPLGRFPHQDLVRTNAFIHAKNAYAAQRPEFAQEGRVLDVEALSRGIVEQDDWMKQGKRGPDAVHFRSEVYDEWVRVLWTDLLGQTEPLSTRATSKARERWKRRLSRTEEKPEP